MENIHIESFKPLVKPQTFKLIHPSTKEIINLVINTRNEVNEIIHGKNKKKIFIVGPCSIHNVNEALIYAKKLKIIADKVKDKILIIMRVYFEKPRTTIGWKGLINDPMLDNSFQVNYGLGLARKLLIDINSIGLPCGCEILDTITPQYISDLISWSAIGARTTESQVHRQMVSGLSMPVGFKNGTNGDMIVARDGVLSALYKHSFMGITEDGEPAICKTKGNIDCHVILRGGKKPNYSIDNIKNMEKLLIEKDLNKAIMVDCSHGNSEKDHKNQHKVLNETILNMKDNKSIIGVMIESNINEGNQKISDKLLYGVSITDKCINLEETDKIIMKAYYEL